MTTINDRLSLLREELQREHLFAFIFPTSDPHQSEYTADCWKGREWISGFNGSAGTAVVTLNAAALWTDSRYFLSAEQQLKGTEYQLMKLKMDGTPTIAEWISKTLAADPSSSSATEVGIDGMTSSYTMVETLKKELRKNGGITLRTNFDPLQRIWSERPPLPMAPVIPQPLKFTGEDSASKLSRIRHALREKHADGMLMASLDDIAWTLNLRGADVHCNPVFIAYLLITTQTVTLFVHEGKLTPEAAQSLKSCGCVIAPYAAVKDALARYPEYNILADPDEVSYTLMAAIKAPEVIRETSPVSGLKAVKTDVEQQGFRDAMVYDGIALVRFLHWLESAVAAGGQTELTVSRELERLRAEQPLYRGLSFDTIAGYEAHGAIVHYEATPETDVPLRPEGLLLLDSGAHYQNGTTDITRTIALGPVSDEERRIYTLVLKGHIQLQLLKFPDGACGTQLDTVARQPLWREGLNFHHGTGHGVGSYLNVHEGLHQIRMEYRQAPFHAGMIVTDEPGIYIEGRFGVRIENMLLVQPYRETAFGRFLQFETLTLCPIDKTPIVPSLLTTEELQWLNDYHQIVYERLASHLDEADKAWLHEATSPIS